MIEQRTEEWHQQRCGKVTASRIADILAKGAGVTRGNYLAELVAERMTGTPYEGYQNQYMERGTELEGEMFAAYEFLTGNTVIETGFIPHPTILMAGASPDRLVNDDGLVEGKARKTALHIGYLLTGKLKDAEIVQMQFQMSCAGRKWCDFVSYDPRMPPELQLFIKRVVRDDKRIAELEGEVVKFLEEVDETAKKLNALKRLEAV